LSSRRGGGGRGKGGGVVALSYELGDSGLPQRRRAVCVSLKDMGGGEG
jgi:hypothetical protein